MKKRILIGYITGYLDNITKSRYNETEVMRMVGINLDRPIQYRHASLRFFAEGEHHITRYCPDDVVLLVYDGILRFEEDSVLREVAAGEYYIQRKNTQHSGKLASDAPKYLYIHCDAQWSEAESEHVLPVRGRMDYHRLRESMERLDRLSHEKSSLTEQSSVFYSILADLTRKDKPQTLADAIEKYLVNSHQQGVTLDELSRHFHYSKNHIINVFRESYGMTPFSYLKAIRLTKAERLLEVTSDSAEHIAGLCGFNDYAYFYRLFREKHGISPQEWRRRRRLSPMS